MNLKFKMWFETLEFEKNAIKNVVLDFLKEKTGITSDEELLNMQIGSIDKSIINDLFLRGIVKNASDNNFQDIKNASITVSELIDNLSKERSD